MYHSRIAGNAAKRCRRFSYVYVDPHTLFVGKTNWRFSQFSTNFLSKGLRPVLLLSTVLDQIDLLTYIPLRSICLRGPRVTLEKRSSNAMTCTPLVATRQDVSLGPIVVGVLYGSWHGYVYTSVSRALLFASWQTLGKPYVTQTSGKPYVIVLYRENPM